MTLAAESPTTRAATIPPRAPCPTRPAGAQHRARDGRGAADVIGRAERRDRPTRARAAGARRQSDPGMAATLPPLPHVARRDVDRAARPDSAARRPDGPAVATCAADRRCRGIDRAPHARRARSSARPRRRSGSRRAGERDDSSQAERSRKTRSREARPIRTCSCRGSRPRSARVGAASRARRFRVTPRRDIDEVFADLTDDTPHDQASRGDRPRPGPHELDGGDEITIEADPPPVPGRRRRGRGRVTRGRPSGSTTTSRRSRSSADAPPDEAVSRRSNADARGEQRPPRGHGESRDVAGCPDHPDQPPDHRERHEARRRDDRHAGRHAKRRGS